MMGYIVDLKEKNGFFDITGTNKKILMAGDTLSRLLLNPAKCIIYSAVSVDIEEYKENHKEFEFWRIK